MRVTSSQWMVLPIKLMLTFAVVVPLPFAFTTTVIAQVAPDPRKAEADQLKDQAIQQQQTGQLQAALRSFQQALVLYRAINSRVDEGNALNGIGIVYRDMGQDSQALDYFQQALAVAQSANNHVDEGQFFNNIGEMYYRLGQYSKAMAYYRQAIAAAEAIDDQVGEYITLSNIGLVYRDLRQYPQAIDYIQRALALAQSVSGRTGKEWILKKLAGGSTKTCPSTSNGFLSVASSPNNRRLVSLVSRLSSETGLFDYQIRQWNLTTEEEVPLSFEISTSLSDSSQGFTAYYFLDSVAFASDGRNLVGAYYDNVYKNVIVKFWQLETGAETRTLQIHFDSNITQTGDVQLSSDGNTLIRYSHDYLGLRTVILWDLANNRLIRTVQFPHAVNGAAISLDNQTIAIQEIDRTINVQNLSDGKRINDRPIRVMNRNSDIWNTLALSSDGRTLAVGDHSGSIQIFNTATGQLIHTLEPVNPSIDIPFLAISADNTTLLTGHKGKIQQWNVVTGRLIHTLCIN